MTAPSQVANLNQAPGVPGGASWTRGHSRGHAAAQSGLFIPKIVDPWPFTNDANGRAYPSDTVGVYFTRFTYQDDSTTIADNCWAVPKFLPAAYTPRFRRDSLGSGGAGMPRGQMAGAGTAAGGGLWPLVQYGWRSDGLFTNVEAIRIREGDALTSYPWMPECYGDLAKSAIGTVLHPGNVGTQYGPTVGLRYIRSNISNFSAAHGWNAAVCPNWRFVIGYNNDPLQGISTQTATGLSGAPGAPYQQVVPPDNIIFTVTVANGATNDSGYMTAATLSGLSSALGTRRYLIFYNELDYYPGAIVPAHGRDWILPSQFIPSSVTNPAVWPAADYYAARVDVPHPFAIGDSDSLVVPGGVVPGALPGY